MRKWRAPRAAASLRLTLRRGAQRPVSKCEAAPARACVVRGRWRATRATRPSHFRVAALGKSGGVRNTLAGSGAAAARWADAPAPETGSLLQPRGHGMHVQKTSNSMAEASRLRAARRRSFRLILSRGPQDRVSKDEGGPGEAAQRPHGSRRATGSAGCAPHHEGQRPGARNRPLRLVLAPSAVIHEEMARAARQRGRHIFAWRPQENLAVSGAPLRRSHIRGERLRQM
jgi:hypothetical protein